MTKILAPLSSHVVVDGETRVLTSDVREDIFFGLKET